jgi:DNA-binding NtrC family response regulator
VASISSCSTCRCRRWTVSSLVRDAGASIERLAIVLTAHGSIERAVHAVKLGAYDFIEKAVDRAHPSRPEMP